MVSNVLKGLGLALTLSVLAGCNSGGGATKTVAEDADGQPIVTDAPVKPGAIEVQAFQGGYGIDAYKQAAQEYKEAHPGTRVKVDGSPRIWEQLRPRFIGGTPPDLAFPGWGMDHWALAEEGQLRDLTADLKTKSNEGDRTWGESFDANILKLGQLDGKQYVLPYYVMLYGWWYDPGVFAKNGWTPPKTYADLLVLSEKIKAKGIAPITFQGKYPYYMIDGMLLPWAMSVGGEQAIKDAQSLKPGAWKAPAFLKAAEMIDELRTKGYLQNGAVAMTHTESQAEFVNGRAAMIPCGTWLDSEMKKVMPPTAKMEFFLPPVVAGGQGDPSALLIGVEPWMIPADAKNPLGAIDLFKYMTSKKVAKRFVEEKGTLMAITGIDDAKIPEVLKVPAKAMADSKLKYAVQYRQWYPAFDKELQNSLTALLNGELTPTAFCDRVEAAAEKTRNDDSIKKHSL